MTTLSPLNRFIVFVLVGGMFASLAFFAAQRTAKFWKAPFVRFARAGRSIQSLVLAGLIAVTALGGGKTNDPPLRALGDVDPPRVVANPPAWFVSLGYPVTDADANGIPDCWEKWTHTTGMADDDDPDGDGLTNYDEFESQTDPIRADTDGDGLDDGMELEGLAAGIADLDPLVPATFAADEPDADDDGVPDIWEESDIAFFDGVDPDGFPWGVDVPEPAATNYDVRLSVSTSRHAALSWSTGESLLLPPCTNLALRLRLCADEDRYVALSPHPAGGSAVGLWKAELAADWSAERMQETEGNRVRTAAGTIVDAESGTSRFVGVLDGTVPPAVRGPIPSRGGPRDETGWWFRRKSVEIFGTGYCAIHGPGLVVTAACEKVSLPLEWSIPGRGTITNGGFEFVPGNHGWESASTEVVCTKRDGKSRILLQARARYDAVPCGQPQTNIVGACWFSSHDPDDPSDHEPRVEEHVVRYFQNCPPTTNVTVVAGFTHETAILWVRNLVRITTGDPRDDETDHCMARDWVKNGSFDLMDFVASETIPFMDQISFSVDAAPAKHMLPFGSKPRRYHPMAFHVEMRLNGESRSLDRMWLVVNHPLTRPGFNQWLAANTNDLSWAARLPKPYACIVLTTNAAGVVSAVDPEPGAPGLWTKPSSTKESFLHHDAEWEMRAYGNSEGHGNQACYDGIGKLIESGISGGTADFSPGFWDTVNSHVENDVNPFLDAVHLDGNPGDTTRMNDVSRPCLRQGSAIDSYIFCRPVVKPLSSP